MVTFGTRRFSLRVPERATSIDGNSACRRTLRPRMISPVPLNASKMTSPSVGGGKNLGCTDDFTFDSAQLLGPLARLGNLRWLYALVNTVDL